MRPEVDSPPGPSGMSSAEAAARLRQYGPNVVERLEPWSLASHLLGQFGHLMAWLLWIAGLLALAAGMPELAVAVWLVNVIN